MGALSYMAAGLAGGVGKGVASYGMDLMKQADQRELLDERQQDRLELQRERMAMQGAGGAPKASLSPAQKLYEFGQLMLSGGNGAVRGALMAGGMEPGAASDASSIMQGQTPTQTVDLPASRFTNPDRQDEAAAGPSTAQAPKYMDGQAAKLMERSRIALRRAMGMIDPAAADDVAKAEGTEQTNDLVRKYAGGDTQAGRGALASLGKTTFGMSGDELTGAVPKGSVAESTVRENNAKAGQASAAAGKYNAERDKTLAEINGDLAKGVSKERLATMLNSLNAYARDGNLDDAALAEVNQLRQEITRQMRGDVSARGGKPAAAPAPAASSGGMPKPKNKAEYDALKPGTRYVAPDGKVRTKG